MLDARQHPCHAPGLRSVTLVGGKITQALQKDIAARGQGQSGQVAVALHGGELPLDTGRLVLGDAGHALVIPRLHGGKVPPPPRQGHDLLLGVFTFSAGGATDD